MQWSNTVVYVLRIQYTTLEVNGDFFLGIFSATKWQLMHSVNIIDEWLSEWFLRRMTMDVLRYLNTKQISATARAMKSLVTEVNAKRAEDPAAQGGAEEEEVKLLWKLRYNRSWSPYDNRCHLVKSFDTVTNIYIYILEFDHWVESNALRLPCLRHPQFFPPMKNERLSSSEYQISWVPITLPKYRVLLNR